MLAATLDTSLSGKMLVGKGVVSGDGVIGTSEGTIIAGQDF